MSGSPTRRASTLDTGDTDWFDDDDDIEYNPDEDDEEDEEDGFDDEFFDAEEAAALGLEDDDAGGDLPIEVALEIGGGDNEEGEAGEERRVISLSRAQLMQVLGRGAFRTLYHNHSRETQGEEGGEDDDEEELVNAIRGYANRSWWAPRSRRRGPPSFEKVPSEVGRDLMNSGTFGSCERSLGQSRKKKLAYRLMRRELGLGSQGTQNTVDKLIAQSLIPSSATDLIVHYDRRCYSGQFSNDGNFFFSCAQDFKVRMYDTSNPYKWKYYKTVPIYTGAWTITDASLSPDNRNLAISSIHSVAYLAPTDPQVDAEPIPLEFDTPSSRYGRSGCGIWSLRFSGDGREIVAGTSDQSVYVYDIESRRTVLRIPGHSDDVNAVCYADPMSPHVLFSGSDDTTLKVWDRRSMADNRPAGVFLGHTEGLTYVDSKGDGRYLISNAKDQTAKLWDMRKMISPDKAEDIDADAYTTGFEYRHGEYDFNDWEPHPHDCSLVTFRGHKVLRTLIRCHFSPPGSTDSRYVYSGSFDGCVYIWNMDATLAGKVDVHKGTKYSREKTNWLKYMSNNIDGPWSTCVRDASWHPSAPMIAATSWNGWGHALGTCSVHTWNDDLDEDEGDPKMGLSLDPELQELESDSNPAASRPSRRRQPRNLLQQLLLSQDDDDM